MAKAKTAVATRKAGVPVSADLMAKIQADIAEQAAMVVPSNSNRIRLNSESGKKYVFPDKSEVDSFEGIVNARMRNKRENPRNPQTKKKYFLIFYLSAIFSHFFQAQIVDNIPAQIEREKCVF